jgi:hypothetical protein
MSTIVHCSAVIAQAGDLDAYGLNSALVAIMIMLVPLLIGCMALLIVMKYVRRAREMLHAERLKSIAAGLPWQDPDIGVNENKLLHNSFWISFWMVAIGCGASFSSVSAAMSKPTFENTHTATVAWCCAAIASIAAVICATLLMLKSRALRLDHQT